MSELNAWLGLHKRKPVKAVPKVETDPEVIALLEERARARDAEHVALINFELKQRGYVEDTPEPKPEEKRAEAVQGDRTSQPQHPTPARVHKPQQRRY